jgi:hypothetical protein
VCLAGVQTLVAWEERPATAAAMVLIMFGGHQLITVTEEADAETEMRTETSDF